MEVAQEIYAKEWAVNAGHYVHEGLYTRLAAELTAESGIARVLDIGCGLGEGLHALQAAIPPTRRLIAGIDENAHCLQAAAASLGLQAQALSSPRLQSKFGLKRYDSIPSTAPIAVEGDVVLIHADILIQDRAMEEWLRNAAPFDAVTLWFTGGHKARSLTKVAERIGAKSDEDFRWAIENRVIDMAQRHLRPGGLIQLVIRMTGDVDQRRRELEWLRLNNTIKDTSLRLVRVNAYPYSEPASPDAIVVAGTSQPSAPEQQMAVSTLLRARDVSTEAALAGISRSSTERRSISHLNGLTRLPRRCLEPANG